MRERIVEKINIVLWCNKNKIPFKTRGCLKCPFFPFQEHLRLKMETRKLAVKKNGLGYCNIRGNVPHRKIQVNPTFQQSIAPLFFWQGLATDVIPSFDLANRHIDIFQIFLSIQFFPVLFILSNTKNVLSLFCLPFHNIGAKRSTRTRAVGNC